MQAADAAHTGDVDRRALSRMLMKLFDHWKLTPEEQLDALGLPTTHRAALGKYRRGGPISASRDTMERAAHLLAIHTQLRLLFPHNRDLGDAWMKSRNKAFENRMPIEVIREYGFAGLLMVVAYLNRALAQ